MNDVQAFVDVLVAELKAHLPTEYSVQAREPIETELKATAKDRQVFVTVGGIEASEPEYADLGLSTRVSVPVMVGAVMRRPVVQDEDGDTLIPQTIQLYAGTTKRRLSIIQALQKARRSFGNTHTHVETEYLGEEPQIVEGYFVSVSGVLLQFNLQSEEQL